MTHLHRIQSMLATQADLCDDCLAMVLGIKPRQTVNGQCRRSDSMIRRGVGMCSRCKSEKIINQIKAGDPRSPTCEAEQKTKIRLTAHAYQREEDLRTRLNGSLAAALGLPAADYYGRLDISRLLALKECLARVHDVVTLKLTLALAEWIAQRLSLSSAQRNDLIKQINQQHPNEGGFDLDAPEINLVAEVKGTIPMNRENSFGSAQRRSLTNDVRQMLGKAPLGKESHKLSRSSKVKRAGLDGAIKILCLCDRPEVRSAAARWRVNLMNASTWVQEMGDSRIEEMPDHSELDPKNVYLVHLEPIHSPLAFDCKPI